MEITFSDAMFECDSREYEILFNAALNIKGVPGAVVEIGTRRGGSAKLIMDALVTVGDAARSMFCIDPYGNLDYVQTNKSMHVHNLGVQMGVNSAEVIEITGDPLSMELTAPTKLDYTNAMRNDIIPSLYYYAYQQGLNFTFFCLEDSEFFARYANGVPVYDNGKKIEDQYAFVFFDGPHTTEAVMYEVEFFLTRCPIGAAFVFDDIWMYDHDKVEQILLAHGFGVFEKKIVKASYIKAR